MSQQSESGQLVLSLVAASAGIIRRAEHQLNIHGISFSELLALHQLASAPGESMRRIDLAERLGMSGSGVTRMLKPLEKIGLVEKDRNPRDARVSLVKLSAAGKTLYRDAFSSFEHAADSCCTPLNRKQQATLAGLLQKLS